MQALPPQQESLQAEETRAEYRHQVHSQIRYRVDSGPYAKAIVKELSLHGMGLLLPVELLLGTRVQILYRHPTLGLSWVEGVVCHRRACQAEFYTGLRLEFRGPADRFPYQALVAQIEPRTLCAN